MKSILFLFFKSILFESNEEKAAIISPYCYTSPTQREITMTIAIKKMRKMQKMAN